MLLASSFDQGSQLQLQRRQEIGENQFLQIWNGLAQRYWGDTQASLGNELRLLQVQNDSRQIFEVKMHESKNLAKSSQPVPAPQKV